MPTAVVKINCLHKRNEEGWFRVRKTHKPDTLEPRTNLGTNYRHELVVSFGKVFHTPRT